LLESGWLAILSKKPFSLIYGNESRVHEVFFSQLMSKITKLSDEFQSKVDMIHEEILR
jgi:hypothetical protein